MPFSGARFDAETLALLTKVFDDAWCQLQSMNMPTDVHRTRDLLAARIMLAASEGERDPMKLKAAALNEMRGAIAPILQLE